MATQKTEADEADLQAAYDRARSIGLFLVEKYAREIMRSHLDLFEFVMGPNGPFKDEGYGFTYGWMDESHMGHESYKKLSALIQDWDERLGLLNEPMRFSAHGPVRREW